MSVRFVESGAGGGKAENWACSFEVASPLLAVRSALFSRKRKNMNICIIRERQKTPSLR